MIRPDHGTDLPRWSARNRRVPTGLAWLVTGLVVALGLLAALLTWWLLPVLLLLVVALVATVRFEVRIDHRGLRVTFLGGRRMLELPIEQIDGAEVTRIDDPLRDFAGWGLRVDRAGRTGVVTRAGTALRVRRIDGGELVMTVDDAWDGAEVLNTLVDHHRRGHDGRSDSGDGDQPGRMP